MTTDTETKKQIRADKRIIRKNKQFEEATPAQRRVMIARDVIAQIKLKKYIPVSMVFVASTHIKSKHIGTELQELLLAEKPPICEVCAVGAIMLSYVRFRNDCHVEESDFDHKGFGLDIDDIRTNFSKSQIELIEMAYEQGGGAFRDVETSQQRKAIDLLETVRDDKKRLIALMENIIENSGTFVP